MRIPDLHAVRMLQVGDARLRKARPPGPAAVIVGAW